MAIRRKLQARAVEAAIPPRGSDSESRLHHSRHCVNPADRFLVEIHHLLRRFLVVHHGNVDGQDVARVEARPCRLHGDERFEKHAGASEEHERSGNLDHGEEAEAPTGAARDADAAARKPRSLRNICGWETGDISKKNGGDDRENSADPENA